MPIDQRPPASDQERLEALDAKIRAARQARRPTPRGGAGDMSTASLAWRMVTELVLGMLIGAGIGWGIDGVAGTLPLFLLIFGMLGFAAGVRTMMRSAEEVTRRGAGGVGNDEGAGGAEKTKGADGAKERS